MDFTQLWPFIGVVIAAMGVLVGIVQWLLNRMWGMQEKYFEENFNRLTRDSDQHKEEIRNLERDLAQLKERLPVDYVRREDWIRFAAVIHGKIEKVDEKLENLVRRVFKQAERQEEP